MPASTAAAARFRHVMGVLIMVMIRNGLNLLGVSPFWQGTANGPIIILALLPTAEHLKSRRV